MFASDVLLAADAITIQSIGTIGSIVVALGAGYFSWQASKDKNRVDEGLNYIKGYDSLTKSQSIELAETKKELKETRTALRAAEQEVHACRFQIEDQAREISRLNSRVASLEGGAR